MYAAIGTPTAKIIKALISLKAGDPESFLTAEIGGSRYDSIQAVKESDGKYHVELLRKGGNPNVFDDNRIFALDEVEEAAAIKLFMTMLQKRDKMQMPAGFKEITTAAANNRRQ